jgi:hypothetical protein
MHGSLFVEMAKPTENPHRIVTFLSDRQMAVLKKISKANYGAPISALVRTAVEEFVEKKAKKK